MCVQGVRPRWDLGSARSARPTTFSACCVCTGNGLMKLLVIVVLLSCADIWILVIYLNKVKKKTEYQTCTVIPIKNINIS